MKRFSIILALVSLGSAFLIAVLCVISFGAKSCGDISWGLYDLFFSMWLFFVAFPWNLVFLASLALAFFFGGFVGAGIKGYWRLTIIGWIMLAIALPLVTAVDTPRAGFPCQPV